MTLPLVGADEEEGAAVGTRDWEEEDEASFRRLILLELLLRLEVVRPPGGGGLIGSRDAEEGVVSAMESVKVSREERVGKLFFSCVVENAVTLTNQCLCKHIFHPRNTDF